MKTSAYLICSALSTAVLFIGCRPDAQDALPEPGVRFPVLPDAPYDYETVEYPDGFGTGLFFFDSTPDDNPVTNAGATLGRVLFYDVNLSANRTTSCGSCHHQEHGFADPVAFSEGHNGGLTARNAQHLVNLRFNRRMFWDLRAQNLEAQVIQPITDAIEMGLTQEQAIARVQSLPYYAELFTDAFGTDEVTMDRMGRALAQFIRSIVSVRSKYDEGVSTDFGNFTESELLGKQIFFNGITRCNQCHFSANFYNTAAMNNGLEVEYEDAGFFLVSGDPADHGKFKVPSLRNVALTAPFMHDGRFGTLMEVVEHYNSGVQPHPFLDERVTVENTDGGTPYQLNLSESEKQALVDFLHTLTDEQLIADPRFSNPFTH